MGEGEGERIWEKKDLKLSSWRRLRAGLALQPSPFLAQTTAGQTLTIAAQRTITTQQTITARTLEARTLVARTAQTLEARSFEARTLALSLPPATGTRMGTEMNPT